MIRQLLEEVKAAPLDDASRQRLRDIHQASIKELEAGLAPELVEELDRLSLPFMEDTTPSDAELRIAQAQLVGWLEGLFHGIQTAIYAQQMAARAQFEQIRRALPPGMHPEQAQGMPGAPQEQPGQDEGRTAACTSSLTCHRNPRLTGDSYARSTRSGRAAAGRARRSARPQHRARPAGRATGWSGRRRPAPSASSRARCRRPSARRASPASWLCISAVRPPASFVVPEQAPARRWSIPCSPLTKNT